MEQVENGVVQAKDEVKDGFSQEFRKIVHARRKRKLQPGLVNNTVDKYIVKFQNLGGGGGGDIQENSSLGIKVGLPGLKRKESEPVVNPRKTKFRLETGVNSD